MRKINYNFKVKDLEYYYSEIIKVRDNRFLLHNKEQKINELLKTINNSFSFKDIILADFSKLLVYVKCIEEYIEKTLKPKILKKYTDDDEKKYVEDFFLKRNSSNHKIVSKITNEKKKEISKEINKQLCGIFYEVESILYENGTIKDCISNFFMKYNEELKIRTCYYCNIDFINVFKNKTKNHFTLDHILPKSKYPYLSISLFNLIPSCYSCNSKFKGTKEFDDLDFLHRISPTSETFDLDKLLEFKLNFDVTQKDFEEKIERISEIKDYKIELTNTNSEKEIDTFLDMFALKGRYNFHKDISFKLLEKRKVYSDSQIKEIARITKRDILDVKKDVFGSVIFNENENNEPFAKYKKDIAKQLGLTQ